MIKNRYSTDHRHEKPSISTKQIQKKRLAFPVRLIIKKLFSIALFTPTCKVRACPTNGSDGGSALRANHHLTLLIIKVSKLLQVLNSTSLCSFSFTRKTSGWHSLYFGLKIPVRSWSGLTYFFQFVLKSKSEISLKILQCLMPKESHTSGTCRLAPFLFGFDTSAVTTDLSS